MYVSHMSNPTNALPPLTWLRAFEAAARHLSFTRAASELNLTQSAVSQHVRSLESFLNRALFVRKTRALELTEDGANYLPVIREAFDLLASGTQAFIGGDRGRSMVLQCNLAFSVFWLAPRLSQLYAQYPWLVLHIVTPIWDPDRHAAGAAVDVRFGRPEDRSGASIPLSSERFFPVCAPDYQGGDIDLNSANLFDCAGVTGSWGTWLKSRNTESLLPRAVNLTSSFNISMQAALYGAGITMSHDTLAKDFLDQGTLIAPFDHRPALAEGYFLQPTPQHDSTPASRAFQTWIQDEMSAFHAAI